MNQKTVDDLPKLQRRVQLLTLASLRLAHGEENNAPSTEIARALRRVSINLAAAGADLAYCHGLHLGVSGRVTLPTAVVLPQVATIASIGAVVDENGIQEVQQDHVGDFAVTSVTKKVTSPAVKPGKVSVLEEETEDEVDEDEGEEWEA